MVDDRVGRPPAMRAVGALSRPPPPRPTTTNNARPPTHNGPRPVRPYHPMPTLPHTFWCRHPGGPRATSSCHFFVVIIERLFGRLGRGPGCPNTRAVSHTRTPGTRPVPRTRKTRTPEAHPAAATCKHGRDGDGRTAARARRRRHRQAGARGARTLVEAAVSLSLCLRRCRCLSRSRSLSLPVCFGLCTHVRKDARQCCRRPGLGAVCVSTPIAAWRDRRAMRRCEKKR